jgi:hypothetical protein
LSKKKSILLLIFKAPFTRNSNIQTVHKFKYGLKATKVLSFSTGFNSVAKEIIFLTKNQKKGIRETVGQARYILCMQEEHFSEITILQNPGFQLL